MKRKSLSLVMISLLVALSMLLSACSTAANAPANQPAEQPAASGDVQQPTAEQPAEAPAEVVEINVISFLTYDENIEGAEYKIVEAFEAAHPEIKVNFQLLPYADYYNSLRTWIAGGTAPDVASLDIAMLQEMALSGALADMDGLVAEDNYDLSIYYPNTLTMFSNGGTLYGLPASFSTVVLFYNKALFDEAGIAYPDDSYTWDKMLEVAKQLTLDKDGDGVTDQWGLARAWWPLYVLQSGVPMFADDMTKFNLTDPAASAGLQAMVDLTNVQKVAPSVADLTAQSDWDMFMQNRLAMFPLGPWGVNPFQAVENLEWDVANMPPGPSGTQATFLFGNAYGVLADSKQKEAAFEFVKFATGPEGGLIRQQAGYEISPVQEIAESEYLKTLEGKEPEHAKIFLDATSYAQTVPVVKHWTEISDLISAELDSALLGNQTVAEGMQNIEQQVNDLLMQD